MAHVWRVGRRRRLNVCRTRAIRQIRRLAHRRRRCRHVRAHIVVIATSRYATAACIRRVRVEILSIAKEPFNDQQSSFKSTIIGEYAHKSKVI